LISQLGNIQPIKLTHLLALNVYERGLHRQQRLVWERVLRSHLAALCLFEELLNLAMIFSAVKRNLWEVPCAISFHGASAIPRSGTLLPRSTVRAPRSPQSRWAPAVSRLPDLRYRAFRGPHWKNTVKIIMLNGSRRG